MIISPKKVWFDDNSLWIELNDARVISTPLTWFPRLLNANFEMLQSYELSAFGIHWENLNEDISIQGLLDGQKDLTTHSNKLAI